MKWWLNAAKNITFGNQAHNIFNDLPKTIREIEGTAVFIKDPKRY